jgi:hypothetical protein
MRVVGTPSPATNGISNKRSAQSTRPLAACIPFHSTLASIRHRNDYGAILLADERFQKPHTQASLPKWIRPYIKSYGVFRDMEKELGVFFKSLAKGVSGIPIGIFGA